jgi:hypothetical protein
MLFSVLPLLLVSLAMGAACSGSKGKAIQTKDADIATLDGSSALDVMRPSTDAVPVGSEVEPGKIDAGRRPDTGLADAGSSVDGERNAADAGVSTPDAAPGQRDSGATEAAPMASETASGEVAPPSCTTFSDPCAAFVGARFRSKAWGSLSFGKQKWVWKYSDAGESGDYTCQDGKIVATSVGGFKHEGEIVGPDCNTMNWDIYGAFQLNGARDPNAPEPLP